MTPQRGYTPLTEAGRIKRAFESVANDVTKRGLPIEANEDYLLMWGALLGLVCEELDANGYYEVMDGTVTVSIRGPRGRSLA